MDALLFTEQWCERGGSVQLIAEMKEAAAKAAPSWPAYWITRTRWGGHGARNRFVTPFPNPVAKYVKEDGTPGEVYKIGKKIEGGEGVYELKYTKEVPDELRRWKPGGEGEAEA